MNCSIYKNKTCFIIKLQIPPIPCIFNLDNLYLDTSLRPTMLKKVPI